MQRELLPHDEVDESAAVFIDADRIRGHQEIEFEAFGDVRFRRLGEAVFAEHLRFDVVKQELTASGKIRFERAGAVVNGQGLRYNLVDSTGEIDQAEYFLVNEDAHARGKARRLVAGSSRTWRETMPLLARDYTVVAPDLLGHGESAKPMGDYSLGAHASGLRDLLSGALGVGERRWWANPSAAASPCSSPINTRSCANALCSSGSGGLGREVSWLLRMLTLPGAEFLMPLFFPRFLRDRGNELNSFLHDRGIRAPTRARCGAPMRRWPSPRTATPSSRRCAPWSTPAGRP